MTTRKPETKEQAQALFRQLVRKYGLEWTASVPREAWDLLNACNELLTEDDRRDALKQ